MTRFEGFSNIYGSGIIVLSVHFDEPYDYIIWKGAGGSKSHKSIIYYDSKGEGYIKWQKKKIYLHDFMRY